MLMAFFTKLTVFIQAIIMVANLWLTPLPQNAVSIRFTSNPSTGYIWVCEQDPEGIVEIANEYFIPKVSFNPVGGAPGTHRFIVAPVADGETTLTFYYKPAWEGTESATEIVNYTLTVSGGKIEMSDPVYG